MIPGPEAWSLGGAFGVFFVATALVVAGGIPLTGLADRLADRTGLGEAVMGAVFLGAVTSISGITASVVAAWRGDPSLALSNAYGGIAVQTAFLAVADVFYRKANLEHAAASSENILFGVMLITLLCLSLWGMTSPEWLIGPVHPATPLLFAAYGFFLHMIRRSRVEPMWFPRQTRETVADENEEDRRDDQPTGRLLAKLLLFAGMVMVGGWLLVRSGEAIALRTGIASSAVGALGTAVATSMPELVTSIAAVRRGALTLAVGSILGGNAFDVLFAAMADIAYTEGSIYHHASAREPNLIVLAMILAGLMVFGLVIREKKGPAGIGMESLLVLVVYVLGMITILGIPA